MWVRIPPGAPKLNLQLNIKVAGKFAVVVELADTQGREPCPRKGVGVQIPPAAPISEGWQSPVYRASLLKMYASKGASWVQIPHLPPVWRRGRVVDCTRLESGHTPKGVSRVRISPSPPYSPDASKMERSATKFGRVLSTATTPGLENRRTVRCGVRLSTLPPF